MLSGLVLASVVITLYAVSAYDVARYAFDAGGSELGWLYTPSGSFLPWSKGPGMATAISRGNGVDLFIYRYLIKSWILAAITVLLWLATILYFLISIRGQPAKVNSPVRE